MDKRYGSLTVIFPEVPRRSSLSWKNCPRVRPSSSKWSQSIPRYSKFARRCLQYQADSFADFLSGNFVSPEEPVFAASGFEDLSAPSEAFGADSFLAAASYVSLRESVL